MHFVEEVVKVLHGAKERVHRQEVFHIVAKVHHGGFVEGADPDSFNVQVHQVLQFLCDTWKEGRKKVSILRNNYLFSPHFRPLLDCQLKLAL